MKMVFIFNSLACDSGQLVAWELGIRQPCAWLMNVNTAVVLRKGQLVLLHGCLPVTGYSPPVYKGSEGHVYVSHGLWDW